MMLAEMADKSGECFPSVDFIADRTRLSPRTVIRKLKELEADGLIGRTRRTTALGYRTSDLIRLFLGDHLAVGSKAPACHLGSNDPSANQDGPDCQPVRVTSQGTAQSPRGDSRRRKPETPLPDGFPGPDDLDVARGFWERQGVAMDTELEAEKFRAHHESRDSRMRSWPAAWRTWRAKAITYAPRRAQTGVALALRDTPSQEETWRIRVQAFKASKYWDDGLGPRPGRYGCRAPKAVLAQLGFETFEDGRG
jgi:DNA-binding transcriptional MocR family regulator